MKYFKYLCQLLIWLFLLEALQSCSATKKLRSKKPKDLSEGKTIEAEAVWFDVPERFTSRNKQGEHETHAFFDLVSYRTKEDLSISYVLLTPAESEFGYDFDLVSGKKYKKFHYCAQKDIWKKYKKTINRPPFSEGMIPRLLDQSGQPQRIWIFGAPHFLKGKKSEQDLTQRARILGAVVLQYCSNYPCRSRDRWTGRLVFIAVNDLDPAMKKLKNLAELKRKVNWAYVKAFAQNGFGRNIAGFVEKPAYRMVGEIEGREAVDFVFKRGHLFEFSEINSLRKNCFHLYDYIWRSVQHVKGMTKKRDVLLSAKEELDRLGEIKKGKTSNAIKERKRNFLLLRKIEKELNIISSWPKFFQHFYKNYGERFRTCQKFVRPSNIRQDYKRHWFFAYLANFMNLERAGYYYNCVRKGWIENFALSSGKRYYDFKKDRFCTAEELDLAFETSIDVMTGLANSSRNHFRYIAYDSGVGASREKIYSWVFSNGKKLSCTSKLRQRQKIAIFPADVSWNGFKTDGHQDFYGDAR